MMLERRVLVTGAGGFIGRWSVPPLLRAGFNVQAALSRRGRGALPAELSGAAVHAADLLSKLDIDVLLSRSRPTHLLHFAWIATPGIYWTSADNPRWLAASQYLLRAFHAQGGIRAMMAGTCAEYDWSRAAVCDEATTPLADNPAAAAAPYTACKIAMQRDLADFGFREHLSTAWGRIFFQFGPHENPNRLVPSVIRQLLLDREAPCSDGRQIRSFLHASDVGAAFAKVLDSHVEGPVNIGSDERISIAELIERIGRQMGRSALLCRGARPAPAHEPPLLVPQINRLRDEAQWRPHFTLDEGLSDVIDWWRSQLLADASARRPS